MRPGTLIVAIFCCVIHAAAADVILGPYESEDKVAELQDFLQVNEINFELDIAEIETANGYILVTAPMKITEARSLYLELDRQGIKDYVYVGRGIYVDRISAGIYSTREAAIARRKMLADRGFDFSIMQRTRTVTGTTFIVAEASASPDALQVLAAIAGESVVQPAVRSRTQETEPAPFPEPAPVSVAPSDPVTEPEPEPEALAPPPVTVAPPAALTPEPAVPEVSEPTAPAAEPVPPPVATSETPAPGLPLTGLVLLLLSILIVIGLLVFAYRNRIALFLAPNAVGTANAAQPVDEPQAPSPVDLMPRSPEDKTVDAVSRYANLVLNRQPLPTGEFPSQLSVIGHGGQHVLDLITDIIDLSRLESGKVDIDQFHVDPESILRQLIDNHMSEANDRGVALHFEFDETLPELLVTDPGKLQRIVARLLNLAIARTESGRILLLATYDLASERLRLDLQHNPSPDSAADIRELFTLEPGGERADEMRLGLNLCQRQIRHLGGHFEIQGEDEVNYIVQLPAPMVRQRQLLLPNGVSIDELIEAEALAQQRLAETETSLESTQAEVAAAQADNERLQAEIAQERAHQEALAEEQTRLRNAETSLAEQLAALEEERRHVEQELSNQQAVFDAELHAQLVAAREQSQEEQARLAAGFESEAERLQADTLAERTRLQAEIDDRTAAQSALNEQLEALREESASTEAEVERLREEHEAAVRRLASNQQEYEARLAGTVEELREQAEREREELVTSYEERLAEAIAAIEQHEAAAGHLENRVVELTAEVQTRESAAEAQQADLDATMAALREELASAREQATTQQEDNAGAAARVAELEARLADTLAEHEANRQSAAEEITALRQQLTGLETERAENQSQLAAESEARGELEARIQSLDEENESLRNTASTLEAQLAESERMTESLNRRIRDAEAELKVAHEEADQYSQQQTIIESEARNNLTVLHDELEQARQLALEQARQTEGSLEKAHQEIAMLSEQLRVARGPEGRRQDAEGLQASLEFAENRMREEMEARRRIEQETAKRIDELMDEVNEARSALKSETRTRETLEQDSAERLALLEAELASAQRALAAEERTRTELARLTEFARDTSAQLDQAESEIAKLQGEKRRIEQRILQQAELLRDARTQEQQRASQARAARQKLTHLAAADADTPLRSSMPMNNPVARSMIERFRARLSEQIAAMRSATASGDYLDIVVATNWLRGEAHNLGFEEFAPIVDRIETDLRKQQFEDVVPAIANLETLQSRIVLADVPVSDGSEMGVKTTGDSQPLVITLPANARKAEILEKFISELGTRLIDMESAWMELNRDQLNLDCRWIARYSSRINIPEIAAATEELQSALNNGDPDRISQRLWNFIALYGRIRLARNAA